MRHRVKRADCRADLDAAQAIRRRVFVEEQGIPAELDFDGEDRHSLHVLGLVGGQAVATARLTPQTEYGCAVLARVAVLPGHRGSGIGARLVEALEGWAAELGVRAVELHPHACLQGFYERLGYHLAEGETIVGGHRLIVMRKRLAEASAPHPADAVGLCATCVHVRPLISGRGSRFYLCRLAEREPRFRKYPPLPVGTCAGYRYDGRLA